MFLFPRRHRPVLGLDITPSSIKLIELTLSGTQYTVDSYAAEAMPQNCMNEKPSLMQTLWVRRSAVP